MADEKKAFRPLTGGGHDRPEAVGGLANGKALDGAAVLGEESPSFHLDLVPQGGFGIHGAVDEGLVRGNRGGHHGSGAGVTEEHGGTAIGKSMLGVTPSILRTRI
jgi:hypothetical protein